MVVCHQKPLSASTLALYIVVDHKASNSKVNNNGSIIPDADVNVTTDDVPVQKRSMYVLCYRCRASERSRKCEWEGA